uniref:Uncharacterized protein n=1 Tax=viral metagenome TaxID=1070528 RepID=A0A6C0IZW0_9ZZZZ
MEKHKEKRPPRGARMDAERKRKLEKKEPIQAMKICGPIALGDQKIASKCLLAIQVFKERYQSEQELKKALRHHLYQDIKRLLVVRRVNKEREFAQQARRLEKELNKVAPLTLRSL